MQTVNGELGDQLDEVAVAGHLHQLVELEVALEARQEAAELVEGVPVDRLLLAQLGAVVPQHAQAAREEAVGERLALRRVEQRATDAGHLHQARQRLHARRQTNTDTLGWYR